MPPGRKLLIPPKTGLILALLLGCLVSSCNLGLNSKDAGEGAPTDLGSKGTLECAGFSCHVSSTSSWSTAAHANGNGIPDSVTGRDPSCAPCHDPSSNRRFAADRSFLAGVLGIPARPVVGCEACHGNGTEHYAYYDTAARPLVWGSHRSPMPSTVLRSFPNVFGLTNCACHSPSRHAGAGTLANQYPEWKGADGPALTRRDGHSDSLVVRTEEGWMTSAKRGVPCAACHTVEGFILFNAGLALEQGTINRIVSQTGDTGLAPPSNLPGGNALSQVSCVTCHAPHQAGRIRAPFTAATLCRSCHNVEGLPPPVPAPGWWGSIPFHPQQEVFAGMNGYEFPGFHYSNTVSAHASVGHVTLACAGCHYRVAADVTVTSYPLRASAGHAFRPRVENCWDPNGGAGVACHAQADFASLPSFSYTSIASFAFSHALVPVSRDHDGDGTVEPLESEIRGQMAALKPLLPQGLPYWDNPRQLFDLGAMSALSGTMRAAAYNYDFVAGDGSYGMHNPLYISNLLAASISVLRH